MHGEQLDAHVGALARRRVQRFERPREPREIGRPALPRLEIGECVEIGLGLVELAFRRQRGRPAQGVPGALDRVAQPEALAARRRPSRGRAHVRSRRARSSPSSRARRAGSSSSSTTVGVAVVADQRVQRTERQPAPRRAQHREPGRAVGEVRERARQRQQVEHRRAARRAGRCRWPGTRCPGGRVPPPRPRGGCGPARGCRCAPRAPSPSRSRTMAATCSASYRRLRPSSACTRTPPSAPGIRARHARRVAHRAAQHVVRSRQHLREARVDPLDHRDRRAEIHRERQRLERRDRARPWSRMSRNSPTSALRKR